MYKIHLRSYITIGIFCDIIIIEDYYQMIETED